MPSTAQRRGTDVGEMRPLVGLGNALVRRPIEPRLEESSARDQRRVHALRKEFAKWHIAAAVAHALQMIAILIYIGLDNSGYWFLRFHSFGRVVFCVEYRLALLLPAFSAGSAFAHVVNAMASNDLLEEIFLEGTNPIRWTEYSITAGVMLWIIATVSGIDDLGTLVLLLTTNAAMMVQGYQSEWSGPQIIGGWFHHIAVWSVISISFFHALSVAKSVVPDAVWAIGPVLFVAFSSFGVLHEIAIRKRDYAQKERWYIVLSFTAKTLLTWLMVGGAMRSHNSNAPFIGCKRG